MANYGVLPTGFSRKPLAVILAEREAAIITEFGPQIVQTPQSPLGQINGVIAVLVSQLWEFAEDVYQSYDPDQSEGVRLDALGKIRLLSRGAETDEQFRRAITNQGRARIDIQDISRAVASVADVTYSKVFVNDGDVMDGNGIPPNSISIAALGGDEGAIGDAIRNYVMPGLGTYGNHSLETEVDGYCRSFRIVRPIIVPVDLIIRVRLRNDDMGCPPPALIAVANHLRAQWVALRGNGDDLTAFSVRSIVEAAFPNIEVVSIGAKRDGGSYEISGSIGFIEIAQLADIDFEVIP